MAKISPADRAAAKKLQKKIQVAMHLCATAPLSRVLQMTQEELKTLMLDLGEDRPTREPGNVMRREVMKLQGEKFHAFVGYAEAWDSVGEQYDATDAAEELLENHKNATVKQLEEASRVLQHFLDTSDEILNYGYNLLTKVTDDDAPTLRQLVAVHGEATVCRQDRVFLAIESGYVTISIKKVTESLAKPFKCMARRAKLCRKRLCRKIKKAKKMLKGKGKKGDARVFG